MTFLISFIIQHALGNKAPKIKRPSYKASAEEGKIYVYHKSPKTARPLYTWFSDLLIIIDRKFLTIYYRIYL